MPTEKQLQIARDFEARRLANAERNALFLEVRAKEAGAGSRFWAVNFDEVYAREQAEIMAADADMQRRMRDRVISVDPSTGEAIGINGPMGATPAQIKRRQEDLREKKMLATAGFGIGAVVSAIGALIALIGNGSGTSNLTMFAVLVGLTFVFVIALGIVNHEIGKALLIVGGVAATAYVAHGAYERHEDKQAQRIADAIRE